MKSCNMLEAKNQLSKLVEAVASGVATEIVIARNGKPAARLVAMVPAKPPIRLGMAKGKYRVGDDIDASNAKVAAMFGCK